MLAIEAAINHLSGERGGIKGVYNRGTQERQKRELMEKWGAHIAGLVSKPEKPVPAKPLRLRQSLRPSQCAGQQRPNVLRRSAISVNSAAGLGLGDGHKKAPPGGGAIRLRCEGDRAAAMPQNMRWRTDFASDGP